jgi:PmbA protein
VNTADLADEIIKYCEVQGAEDIGVVITNENKRMLRFSDNSITVVQTWKSTIPLTHMNINGNRVTCKIEDLSLDAIKDTIYNLMKLARMSKPSEITATLPKGPFKYAHVKGIYDSRIPKLDEELVDISEEAINAALEKGAKRVTGVLMTTTWNRLIKTTAGADGVDKGTMIELTVRAFAADEASGHDVKCSTTLSQLNPETAGSQAGELAKMALNPKEGKEGRYLVILSPSVVGNLSNTVVRAASAYMVDVGMSMLTGKRGEKLSFEGLTLCDDPRFPRGPGSVSFDDEGCPTKRLPIIEKGTLKNYLLNSYLAKKFNVELSGSAYWVDHVGAITPSARNIVIEPGDRTEEELFKEVKDGLFISNNWYTTFQNMRTSDFSSMCRDATFQIKNGEMTQPVKGIRISDPPLRVLASIKKLSRERIWTKSWESPRPFYTPYFIVENMGITRATK